MSTPPRLSAEALENTTRAMTDPGPRLVATPEEEAARAAAAEVPEGL